MPIYILTFHSAYSYGAVLQAYALQQTLCQMHDDVQILDVRPPEFTLSPDWRRPRTLLRWWSFNFRNRLRLSAKMTPEEVRTNPPKGIYVIGSDQVWNPEITRSADDIYYGDFIPDDCPKITYAASFGRERRFIPEEELRRAHSLIHGFLAVSCREETATRICRDELGIESVTVLDPSLLKTDWSDVVDIPDERDELGVFALDNSEESFEAAKTVANELHLKPKIINKPRPKRGFSVIPYPTIPRFLKEVATSQFIITNSFHGVAFSVILRRQFVCVVQSEAKATRIQCLLEQLGLENRMFKDYKSMVNSLCWQTQIDYDTVHARLDVLRASSMAFLERSIRLAVGNLISAQ